MRFLFYFNSFYFYIGLFQKLELWYELNLYDTEPTVRLQFICVHCTVSVRILQWSVVGDTFPVGCRPSDHVVFGPESFAENPDFTDAVYRFEI